jgi:NAD(P)-dependent dehydrogenase (short-subunit alcohol dehydrogenase family)
MPRKTYKFKDKLVLLTGAGSGIGRATALQLAALGGRILVVDLNLASATQVASEINALNSNAQAFELDVANREAYQDFAIKILDQFGPPDILINNAGVGLSGSFLDMDLKDWDWIVSINLWGVIHGCHFFSKAMAQRGSGHIVNMASAMAYFYRDTEIAYVTTKASVLALSKALRADLARYNVGVSAICPGIINTPIISRTRFKGKMSEENTVSTIKQLFAKYGHPPEKVAKAIIFAISKNVSVMPVGGESYFAYILDKVLPPSLYAKLISLRPAFVGNKL